MNPVNNTRQSVLVMTMMTMSRRRRTLMMMMKEEEKREEEKLGKTACKEGQMDLLCTLDTPRLRTDIKAERKVKGCNCGD